MFVNSNIRYLRSKSGLSQEGFGNLFGINRGNVASYEAETQPDIKILLKIVNHFDITLDDIVKRDLQNKSLPVLREKLPVLADQEALYQKKEKGIPLVSAECIGGFGNTDFTIKDTDIQQYYVVPDFQNIDFMIRVKGSSMYPKYNSGDIVACRILKEPSYIQWNKVHVLATRDQGTLIKRLRKGENDKVWLCTSDNKDYDSFEIPRKDVTGVALVIGVIRLE